MAFLPPLAVAPPAPRRGAISTRRGRPPLLPHPVSSALRAGRPAAAGAAAAAATRGPTTPPTAGLAENVAALPSTAHIARLDLTITAALSATPLVAHAAIANVDGSRASVAIYAAIADGGIIAAGQATRGLELYGEAVGDGGVHPNIEILQQVAAGETIVEITPVLV